jgi:hypothetical protein
MRDLKESQDHAEAWGMHAALSLGRECRHGLMTPLLGTRIKKSDTSLLREAPDRLGKGGR